MKWLIMASILVNVNLGFSQLPENLVELREKKVITMRLVGSSEIWSFAYQDNLIRTSYAIPQSFTMGYYSYLNKSNRLDSMVIVEINEVTEERIRSIEYFKYDYDSLGRLQSETFFSEDHINKELFFYDSKGKLDSTAWFRNLKRELFRDKLVDSLILWETKKFSYDQSGRITMVNYWNGSQEYFEYTDENQLRIKITTPFNYQNGCEVGEDRYYETISYFYNYRNLIAKEVQKKYKLKKKGKWRRVHRNVTRYIYEYYGV